MHYSALLVAISAAIVVAECPNACSGHGDCMDRDECECFKNYIGADCSERVCPFGLAFVDTPRGDLNHDGTVDDSTVTTMWSNKPTHEDFLPMYLTDGTDSGFDPVPQEGHFYAECSGKGLCDRQLGVCECFDGYTGSSCQRTTCPNDCSGHGICRTVEEIAASGEARGLNYRKASSVGGHNEWTGVTTGFEYRLWDADKNQACVCDPGYTGPDCSLRECPRGDDPLTHRARDCGGEACLDEVQQVVFEVAAVPTPSDVGYIARFTDWAMKTWSTDVFDLDFAGSSSEAEAVIGEALTGIPNDVFETVDVTCDLDTASAPLVTFTCDITFISNPGNIATLDVTVAGKHRKGDGSIQNTDILEPVVSVEAEGNKEEITCSGRGICNYETGLCECFKGYYHDDCSVQSALAM